MIAELEGVLVRVRGLAASHMAAVRDRHRRLVNARIQEQSWREAAEIALSSGRENWARAALFEKQKRGRGSSPCDREHARVDPRFTQRY